MPYRVVKITQTQNPVGTSREPVTGFVQRWAAEGFVKSETSKLTEEQKGQVSYQIEESTNQLGVTTERRIQTYRITEMPLKKGFINVTQSMRGMFPALSTRITVHLDEIGQAELKFDAINRRVYGLTKWFRVKDVRPGTIIGIERLGPEKGYRFTTLPTIPGYEQREEAVKVARLGNVKPRQPASESSLIVGKGGEYHVIGRLLEKKLEVYTPVADIGGVDAIIRFPNGGTKEVQVKTRTRTTERGEVFQVRAEKRSNYYIVLHIADSDDFWILPSEIFYKKASKQGKEMQLILTEARKKELAKEGYYNNWYLLEEE